MTEWIIILAAGQSTRFNGIKALAPWADGTMLSRAINTARMTQANIMVVTGAHHDKIILHLSDVPFVFNADWPDGMGRSLATGFKAVLDHDKTASLITILPVDQPFVTADHLTALAAMAKQHTQCVLTQSDAITGPPAAIPQPFFKDILSLNGERGLKSVLQPSHYHVIPHAEALYDIDTQEDWAKSQSKIPDM